MRRAGRSALAVFAVAAGAMTLGATGSGAPIGASVSNGVGGTSANSASFVDPTGDGVAGAPDVTSIRVSNDDGARLRFEIVFANRSDLTQADFVNVYLDTDRSSSTGCNLGPVGVDRSITVRGKTEPELDGIPILAGWAGCESEPFEPSRQNARGIFSASTLSLEVNASDLGPAVPTGFRFVIVAQVDPIQEQRWDLAPNQFGWTYDIKVSTSPAVDRTPPRVRALPSSGALGGVARLRYSVFDESKKSREEIQVQRGTRLVTVLRTTLGPRNVTKIYVARWRVPKQAEFNLRFCVRAWDAAGNRSAPSCSALKLR